MLVLPEKRKLVLNTKLHAEVVAAIPHAKTFTHAGKLLTAVPHGVEETVVLKNMGFKKTPAPILSYYDWPGRYSPMSHQRETAAFMTTHRRALCLNSPGTGKSLSSLWAADYLLTTGAVKRVLIIAPLSTLKPVWGTEIVRHLPYRRFAIATGNRARKLQQLLDPSVKYGIVGHDSFTTLAKELAGEYDLVIYDELTAVKTPGTQRFRVLAKWLTENNTWFWGLTGTPISQTPVDAWAMAKLVNSPTVPKSFTAFRDMVMEKVSTFRWVPRPAALDICKAVLQPSIRFSLDECQDIPDTLYLDHECEMTTAQKNMFKIMQEDLMVVLQGTTVSAANAAVMLSKLLQISCGAVYDQDGNVVDVDSSLRYDALKEIIDEVGGKVILYVPFRAVQKWLSQRLVADGLDVAVVNGDVSKTARDKIFTDFQSTDRIDVLLAHPKVASHGLTLTRSSDVIWFAPIYSLEMYEQANARIRRLGTTGKTRVHHLYASPFEKELYRRLKTKQRVLTDFLKMVAGANE
jgi:SNF2 family DNA or RNA helicase